MTGDSIPRGLVVLAAASILVIAGCGSGSRTPQVASLQTTTTLRTSSGHSGGSSATTQTKGNAAALVDEWAACERSHGDPGQADPIIDAYGVINITLPPAGEGRPAGDPHDLTGTCSQYLAAAQSVLRAANPVPPPPDQTELLKYVECMRANGVPNYPYPTGNKTNFSGTGVDPNSPQVQSVNKLCGQKLRLPAWWVAGTGPPGDVVVGPGIGPSQSGPTRVPGPTGPAGSNPTPANPGA